MQLILYGTAADQNALLCSLAALPDWCYREMTVTACPDNDRFITSLGKSPPDCIVIAMDGAAGMEGGHRRQKRLRNRSGSVVFGR